MEDVFKYSLSFELGKCLKTETIPLKIRSFGIGEVFKNGNHPFKDSFIWNWGNV